MRNKVMSLQLVAIFFIIIASFLGSGVYFCTLNTQTMKAAIEAETSLSSSLLANNITISIPERSIVTGYLDASRIQSLFSADERLGDDVDSWIIADDGTIYYANGNRADGNLLTDDGKGIFSSSYLAEAAKKGEFSIWTGKESQIKLNQEYLTVRPMYEGRLFLVMQTRCSAEKELQHKQFTSLMTADLILLIAVIVIISHIFASYRSRLIRLATTDELTGLSNRKSFTTAYEEYIKENPEEDLSLFLLDIDFFKQINDNYGHAAGDRALQHLGVEIQAMVEGRNGFAGRWGGDEFIGVMPIPSDEALLELQMLCRRIQLSKMEDGYTMTISAGIVHSKNERSLVILSEQADEALYQSKEGGRNRATLSNIGKKN